MSRAALPAILEHGRLVLQELGRGPVRNVELAQRTGLPLGAVKRLVAALRQTGYPLRSERRSRERVYWLEGAIGSPLVVRCQLPAGANGATVYVNGTKAPITPVPPPPPTPVYPIDWEE